MKEKPIIVIPKDTSSETLTALTAAGYIPILCDDPAKVVLVTPQNRIMGDDLFMSALHGLASAYSTEQRSEMVKELHRRLLNRESPKV